MLGDPPTVIRMGDQFALGDEGPLVTVVDIQTEDFGGDIEEEPVWDRPAQLQRGQWDRANVITDIFVQHANGHRQRCMPGNLRTIS